MEIRFLGKQFFECRIKTVKTGFFFLTVLSVFTIFFFFWVKRFAFPLKNIFEYFYLKIFLQKGHKEEIKIYIYIYFKLCLTKKEAFLGLGCWENVYPSMFSLWHIIN